MSKKQLLLEAIEKINENIMTPEVKAQIVEAFDSAVDEKANEKVAELQESVVKAVEDHLNAIVSSHVFDLQESVDSASKAMAKEISEAYAKDLQESTSAQFDFEVKVLVESVNQVLQKVVNEAVEEMKPAMKNDVDIAKAQKIMEAAVEFSTQFGIALQEADKSEEEKAEEEEKDKKIKDLEEEVACMKKEKLVKESVEGLTDTQVVKFQTLIESIPFEDVESYSIKLKAMREIIESSKIVDKPSSSKSVGEGKKPSWER